MHDPEYAEIPPGRVRQAKARSMKWCSDESGGGT